MLPPAFRLHSFVDWPVHPLVRWYQQLTAYTSRFFFFYLHLSLVLVFLFFHSVCVCTYLCRCAYNVGCCDYLFFPTLFFSPGFLWLPPLLFLKQIMSCNNILKKGYVTYIISVIKFSSTIKLLNEQKSLQTLKLGGLMFKHTYIWLMQI